MAKFIAVAAAIFAAAEAEFCCDCQEDKPTHRTNPFNVAFKGDGTEDYPHGYNACQWCCGDGTKAGAASGLGGWTGGAATECTQPGWCIEGEPNCKQRTAALTCNSTDPNQPACDMGTFWDPLLEVCLSCPYTAQQAGDCVCSKLPQFLVPGSMNKSCESTPEAPNFACKCEKAQPQPKVEMAEISQAVPEATTPCCGSCTAPQKKYFSIDTKRNMCGEVCINPLWFRLFKIFEPSLAGPVGGDEIICKEKHFSTYNTTVTHGAGPIHVTLDLYNPDADVEEASEVVEVDERRLDSGAGSCCCYNIRSNKLAYSKRVGDHDCEYGRRGITDGNHCVPLRTSSKGTHCAPVFTPPSLGNDLIV